MAAVATPNDQDRIKFLESALKELETEGQLQKVEDNVKQVAVWANQVDESFDKITRRLKDLVDKGRRDFPYLTIYYKEWTGYGVRWVEYLSKSRDVASAHIAILKRFSLVFLEIIEQIQSDEDRRDVIKELKEFLLRFSFPPPWHAVYRTL